MLGGDTEAVIGNAEFIAQLADMLDRNQDARAFFGRDVISRQLGRRYRAADLCNGRWRSNLWRICLRRRRQLPRQLRIVGEALHDFLSHYIGDTLGGDLSHLFGRGLGNAVNERR